MRLLHRFGPGLHRWKIDDPAVILGGIFGPDLFHRLDLLAHLRGAGLVDGAVVFHLFGIPAAADAEQEAAVRYLVERCDELRGLDRIPLDHQANSSAQPQPGRDCRGGAQRDERIHHVEILFGQGRFAEWMGEPTGDGYVRVLRHQERVKAALLQRHRQIGPRYRVISEKNRCSDFHVVPPQP